MRVFRNPLRLARRTALHRGFSLVEMLVTLAIILVLFVMLYGFGSKSSQQKKKRACERNLQTLYVALELFGNEHNASFPLRTNAQTSDQALAVLVPQYISVTAPFICPGSKDKSLPEGESIDGRRISYSYYMGRRTADASEVLMTDEQVDAAPKIQGSAIFSRNGKRPGNNHHQYGGNYLYCDGRTGSSGPMAPHSLVLTQGVILLNPRHP